MPDFPAMDPMYTGPSMPPAQLSPSKQAIMQELMRRRQLQEEADRKAQAQQESPVMPQMEAPVPTAPWPINPLPVPNPNPGGMLAPQGGVRG